MTTAPPTVGIRSRRDALFALAILLLGLALTAMFARTQLDSARRQAELRVDEAGLEMERDLAQRVEAIVALLRATAGLFHAGPVDEASFRRFVARLDLPRRYPGVLGIAYTHRFGATRPTPEALAALRGAASAPIRIWPDTNDERERHAIVLIEPLDERNAAALGFDMYSHPVRAAAMDEARDAARATISGRVTLVQEIEGAKQAGFLIYVPVWRTGLAPATRAQRRAELAGYAYAPLRAGDFLAPITGDLPDRGLRFSLYDGDEVLPERLLTTEGRIDEGVAWRRVSHFEVHGHAWTLLTESERDASYDNERRAALLFAAAGTLVSLLLALGALVQARARGVAEYAAARSAADHERIAELVRELEERDRGKDAFLATLGHELRNPLAALTNALAVLARVDDAPRRARMLDIARRQSQQMTRLVDDLLEVSRIARGKIALLEAPLDLRDALKHAVETAQHRIDEKRHRLELLLPDASLPMQGDAARLSQVFGNLLGNAARYTPEGGSIRLAAHRAGAIARIEVEDDGVGISPENLERIFEPFYQARGAAAHGGGLGIGLALVRRLVEMHGGRVEARSDGPGKGSTFVVELPLAVER